MVETALGRLAPAEDSVLMIENVGNLVCPAGFDLGEAHKVRGAVGDRRRRQAAEVPRHVPRRFADAAEQGRPAAAPEFDVERCLANARRVNPAIEIIQVSATSGAGHGRLAGLDRARCARGAAAAPGPCGGAAPARGRTGGRRSRDCGRSDTHGHVRPSRRRGRTPRHPRARPGAGRRIPAVRLSPGARSGPGRLGAATTPTGVSIEVQGAAAALARFEQRLAADAPPLARVDRRRGGGAPVQRDRGGLSHPGQPTRAG